MPTPPYLLSIGLPLNLYPGMLQFALSLTHISDNIATSILLLIRNIFRRCLFLLWFKNWMLSWTIRGFSMIGGSDICRDLHCS